jgi:hypothetical protein
MMFPSTDPVLYSLGTQECSEEWMERRAWIIFDPLGASPFALTWISNRP